MERQLANLTGLVQKALTHAPHTSPSPRDYLQVPAGRDPYARGPGTLSLVRSLFYRPFSPLFAPTSARSVYIFFPPVFFLAFISPVSAKGTLFLVVFFASFCFLSFLLSLLRYPSIHFSLPVYFQSVSCVFAYRFASTRNKSIHSIHYFFSIRSFVALRNTRSVSSFRWTDFILRRFTASLRSLSLSLSLCLRECSSILPAPPPFFSFSSIVRRVLFDSPSF